MNHLCQQTAQAPFIIFEKEKKEETAEAEKRITNQEEDQRKIEEKIKRRKEASRDKSQHEPAEV